MDFEAKISLSEEQVSEIISEYVKNKTGNTPSQISFNVEYRARGAGGYTAFTGATVIVTSLNIGD